MMRCFIIIIVIGLISWLAFANGVFAKDDIESRQEWFKRFKQAPFEKQREMAVERYKEIIGYDKLPGKDGKLKPGFNFQKAVYNILKDYVLEDDDINVIDLGKPILRRVIGLGFTKDNIRKHITITIMVSSQSTGDAQDSLLRIISNSSMPIEGLPKVGSQKIGDFNLGYKDIDLDGFVRNNITVEFLYECAIDGELIGPRDEKWAKEYPVIELAKRIDAQIQKLPVMSKEELTEKLPKFEFVKAAKTKVKVGEKVELQYKIKDADKKKKQYTIRAVTLEKPVGREFKPDKKGEITLTFQKEGKTDIYITVIDKKTLLSSFEVISIDVESAEK